MNDADDSAQRASWVAEVYSADSGYCSAIMILSLLLSCSGPPDVTPQKPDIVLVVVDTLRADHLGVYGHSRPTSPYMDELATSGTWFHRAYAASGWTLPSMATLMSGLHAYQHQVGRMAFRENEFGKLDAGVTTVAESLKAVGYSTAAVVNNTFMAPAFALDQGFDVYDYMGASINEHRSAQTTVETGLRWLDGVQGSGFLVLHFMEPHLDYEATDPHFGRFAPAASPAEKVDLHALVGASHGKTPPSSEAQEFIRQRYDEEILHVDDAIRGLVAQLKSRGRWDNTVLVITSDHGEEFWDHGGYEHGHTLMGELTRVPLIIAGAGKARGRVDAIVEHVDLSAGLVGLGGGQKTAGAVGTDLWAIMDGTAKDHVDSALSENTMYGPGKVSIVDKTARLEFVFQSRAGSLWRVDSDGVERKRVDVTARQATGQRLNRLAKDKRGGLMPIEGDGGVTIRDNEMFNQLLSLGYIDGPAPDTEGSSESSDQPEPAKTP